MSHEKRIADLEDTLKQRDRRIEELKQDLQQQQDLVAQQAEAVDDMRAVIEGWIDAFDMKLGDEGLWTFDDWVADWQATKEHSNDLVRKWNKFVPLYNAKVAAGTRNIGRPLAASDAQAADVLKRRQSGQSLRGIAEDMNLALQTVRTIVDKKRGVDRATLARLERIAPDKAAVIRQRRQARDIATLPSRINTALKTAADLRKQAKGLR